MEQKPNSGVIFKNDRKETETQPDYKGQALIGGVEYWIAVWVNTSAAGKKYMATRYTAKEGQENTPGAPTTRYDPQATPSPTPLSTTEKPAQESSADDLPF